MLLYSIYSALYGPFFTNWISMSNFAYSAAARVSAENIGIKIYALSPSWPLFTTVVLPILKQIYQISRCSLQRLRGVITS